RDRRDEHPPRTDRPRTPLLRPRGPGRAPRHARGGGQPRPPRPARRRPRRPRPARAMAGTPHPDRGTPREGEGGLRPPLVSRADPAGGRGGVEGVRPHRPPEVARRAARAGRTSGPPAVTGEKYMAAFRVRLRISRRGLGGK